VVARLKQDRRVVNELPVQNWVHTDDVFINLWLNLVGHIVIDRVSHVFGQHVFETFLIEHVIIEDLNQNIQETFILIRIESDLKDLVAACVGTRA